jgi:hypothetical protein
VRPKGKKKEANRAGARQDREPKGKKKREIKKKGKKVEKTTATWGRFAHIFLSPAFCLASRARPLFLYFPLVPFFHCIGPSALRRCDPTP